MKDQRRTWKQMALLATLLLGYGCGSSGGTETGNTDEPNVPSIAASLKLASDTAPSSSLSKGSVGQAPAAGLISMKYYITSITICEDMTTTGTAFSNPTGCLELYAGNQNDSRYTYELDDDFAPFGDVARQSDEGFVDLIDDASRATLNSTQTLTSEDVRSYNYGYINWYLPVKLTAEVDLGDGVIFRSQDGTTVTVNQGPVTTATSNFSQASSAAEAVVVMGNGGSWFKFQNPFVINQSDIDDNVQFALDLTFNPEGLVKAYDNSVGGCGSCILKDNVGNQLLVPMIDLTPVPHRASENVVKETYVAVVQSGDDQFDIRIELYSVEGDVARTIFGVDTATLVNADTTTAVSPFPKVAFISTADDETLELQDYRGESGPLISGFQRQSVVGESAAATLHCSAASDGGFSVDGCSNTTKAVTFTLESSAILQ